MSTDRLDCGRLVPLALATGGDSQRSDVGADDFAVRVDLRTGIAYAYEFGTIPTIDELSPWRRK